MELEGILETVALKSLHFMREKSEDQGNEVGSPGKSTAELCWCSRPVTSGYAHSGRVLQGVVMRFSHSLILS